MTPSPTASTTPAPSCPSSIGNGEPQFPCSIAHRSLWQTPLADDPDEDLARARIVDQDRLDRDRPARLVDDGADPSRAIRSSCLG